MRNSKMDLESRPVTPPPQYTSRAPSIRPPQYTSRAPSLRVYEPTERTPLFAATNTGRRGYSKTYTEIRIRRGYYGGKRGREQGSADRILSCIIPVLFWICVVGLLVLGGHWAWMEWFGDGGEEVVRVGIVGEFDDSVLLYAWCYMSTMVCIEMGVPKGF
jgi:hypothetical protein